MIDSLLANMGLVELHGSKLKKVWYARYKRPSTPIDIYIATPDTWPTLLLIRTGSKENNIRLCTLAKTKRWHLKANGDGLFNEHAERIAGDAEESI